MCVFVLFGMWCSRCVGGVVVFVDMFVAGRVAVVLGASLCIVDMFVAE